MEDITVFSHLDCIAKDNGENHPEKKERLEVILDSIKRIGQLNISFKDSPLADFKTINLVHPQSYLNDLLSMVPTTGLVGVEKEPYADTILCPQSKEAILRACGAGIESANELMSGAKRLFCAVRPPGHHAETIRANGFCFIILISAGFDAHKRDPLASINLESEDFYTLTKNIVEIAKRHSNGRIISFLEGGYDLQALSECIEGHLKALST